MSFLVNTEKIRIYREMPRLSTPNEKSKGNSQRVPSVSLSQGGLGEHQTYQYLDSELPGSRTREKISTCC